MIATTCVRVRACRRSCAVAMCLRTELVLMPSRPVNARWLHPEQAQALTATIEAEDARHVPHELGVLASLRHPRVVECSCS